MTEKSNQHIGFFPNFLSVGIFVLIMVGLFFGFTRFYPELAERYILSENGNGQVTNGTDSIAADIAPFVRGIVSGVKTGQLSSVRESGPLNINDVEGYEHGVRTALLASKNWYNIDRQLFRVRGIELGVVNAIQLSKTEQGRATLEFQVKLIQRIQAAISVNLEELLDANEDNREQTLRNYLDGLITLAEEANLELENMQRIIDEAQAELSQANQTSEQFGDSFISETEEFVTENIDVNLNLFLEARKQAEVAKVRINSTVEIRNRLGPLAARLGQIIPAIEANFEALAAGIKVSPSRDVNLPIFGE